MGDCIHDENSLELDQQPTRPHAPADPTTAKPSVGYVGFRHQSAPIPIEWNITSPATAQPHPTRILSINGNRGPFRPGSGLSAGKGGVRFCSGQSTRANSCAPAPGSATNPGSAEGATVGSAVGCY